MLSAVLLIGSMSACSSADVASSTSAEPSPSASREVVTLNIGAVPATSALLMWTAQEQGFFTKHDLEVNLQPANGGAATVPALQGGAIQIGQANVLSSIQAKAAGFDIPCFLGNTRLSQSAVFLPLMASKESNAKTAADLIGKTIAVNALGGVQELVASAYLQSQNVDPKSVEFVAVEIPAMAAALTSGQVDAAIMTAPFSNVALSQGASMIAEHPESAIGGDVSFACYIATRSWLENNGDAVARFKDALSDARAYLEDHPGYDAEVVAKYLKTEPDLVKNGLPDVSEEISAADAQLWIDLGVKYGILEEAIDPNSVIFK